jgi:hypothetical protein
VRKVPLRWRQERQVTEEEGRTALGYCDLPAAGAGAVPMSFGKQPAVHHRQHTQEGQSRRAEFCSCVQSSLVNAHVNPQQAGPKFIWPAGELLCRRPDGVALSTVRCVGTKWPRAACCAACIRWARLYYLHVNEKYEQCRGGAGGKTPALSSPATGPQSPATLAKGESQYGDIIGNERRRQQCSGPWPPT